MEINYELNEVEQVAKQIIKQATSKTLLFYGNIGAGKTTLIKSIVKELGSIDDVSSPTFSIINEYRINNNDLIYHFDLYRINDVEDAYNFGIEEYLETDAWKLIEWPELIEPIILNECNKIYIKFITINKRVLRLNINTNSPNKSII